MSDGFVQQNGCYAWTQHDRHLSSRRLNRIKKNECPVYGHFGDFIHYILSVERKIPSATDIPSCPLPSVILFRRDRSIQVIPGLEVFGLCAVTGHNEYPFLLVIECGVHFNHLR